MMARDRTEPRSEYKGRPTTCSDAECPCRPCWNAHDCGYRLRSYDGVPSSGGYVVHMECATRHNNGCPTPKPEPQHVYSSPRARVCKRCGQGRPTQARRAELHDELRSLIWRHTRAARERFDALQVPENFDSAADLPILMLVATVQRDLCLELLGGREPKRESDMPVDVGTGQT